MLRNAVHRGASALAIAAALSGPARATTYMWQYDPYAQGGGSAASSGSSGTTTSGSTSTSTSTSTSGGAATTAPSSTAGGTSSSGSTGSDGSSGGAATTPRRMAHPFSNPAFTPEASAGATSQGSNGSGSAGATTPGSTGTAAGGSMGAGTGATGSTSTGSGTTGSGTIGSGATGSASTGSGTTGSGTTGSGTTGPVQTPAQRALGLTATQTLPATAAPGDAVAARYVASGGKPPYAFQWGALADGLSTTTDDTSTTLSGVPAALGDVAPMTLTVTDAAGSAANVATGRLTVVAPPALQLYVAAQPNFPSSVEVGTQIEAYVAASGGVSPYSFDVRGAPDGVTWRPYYYDDSVLTLAGAPAVGAYGAGVVTVTDSSSPPLTGTVSLSAVTVVDKPAAPLSETLVPELPTAMASGTAVDSTLYAYGGKPPYAATAASLPSGLTFSFDPSSSTGRLSGTPADGAEPSATITVTDSSSPPNVAKYRTNPFSVTPDGSGITISADFQLPDPTAVGTSGYGGYEFSGGTGNYTVTTSDLPAGLTFLDQYDAYKEFFFYPYAMFLFAPQTAGVTQGFSLTVSDDAGATATYAFNGLTATPADNGPLALTARGDLSNQVNPQSSVDAHVFVSGGTPPYRTVSVSPLAPGLAVSGDPDPGTSFVDVSGVPTHVGRNAPMTLVVADAAGAQASVVLGGFTLLPPPPLVITPNQELPSSVALGDGLSGSYGFSGGIGPYVATSGDADPGMTVSSSQWYGSGSFQVYGRPTQVGANAPMTLTVTDATGAATSIATAAFDVTQVGDATHLGFSPAPEMPSSASYGAQVSARYEVFGGTPPYHVASQSLPAGLSAVMDAPDGRLGGLSDAVAVKGVPTASGANPAGSVVVADAAGHVGTVSVPALAVSDDGSLAPLTISEVFAAGQFSTVDYNPTAGEPSISVGTDVEALYGTKGGVYPITMSFSGSYPGVYATVQDAVSYYTGRNEESVLVTGSPSETGESTTLTVTARDAVGHVATRQVHPFLVSDAAQAAASPLTFVRTGDVADLAVGDAVSVPFQTAGGDSYSFWGYKYPVTVSYALIGMPKGVRIGNVDQSFTAVLGGSPTEGGTFSPVVVATDDYRSSVSYRMKPFTVTAPKASAGGLCLVSGFSYGAYPTTQGGDHGPQDEYAVVGCGTAPYSAVVTSGTADVAAGVPSYPQSGTYGDVLTCQPASLGVIALTATGGAAVQASGVSVRVYDAYGLYVDLPPFTGQVPVDPQVAGGSNSNGLFGYCYL